MAILDWSAVYPGRADAPSAEYPQGSPRNSTTSGNGTPYDETWLLDIVGFFQALLAAGGVTADGSAETALSSQYMTALLNALSGDTVYSGTVIAGAGGDTLPSGWTVDDDALPGAETVLTHNLGHSNYSATATALNVTAGYMVEIEASDDNTVTFGRRLHDGSEVEVDFEFILVDRGTP